MNLLNPSSRSLNTSPLCFASSKHLGFYKSARQRAVALGIVLVDHAHKQRTSLRLVQGWHVRMLAQKKTAFAGGFFC